MRPPTAVPVRVTRERERLGPRVLKVINTAMNQKVPRDKARLWFGPLCRNAEDHARAAELFDRWSADAQDVAAPPAVARP